MIQYDSSGMYISSVSSIQAKIAAVDAIIDALLVAAADNTATSGITEYTLNDGQTVIKGVYRSQRDIMRGIQGFERIKNYYINKLNSRVKRIVDSKSVGKYGH